jgi:hypothetical protein
MTSMKSKPVIRQNTAGSFFLVLFLSAALRLQGQLTYITNTGGESITITGYEGTPGIVNIPSAINGLPVTAIEQSAFSYKLLTSITIPGSVTNIGTEAFQYCYYLTNLVISNGVTSIGARAFVNCTNLGNVTIPESVTNFENSIFEYCYVLSNVTLTVGLTSIGAEMFSDCYALTSVAIPGTVTNIGTSSFSYCRGLTNLIISNGVTAIESGAFQYCTNLPTVTIPASVTNIDQAVFGNCYSLLSVFFRGKPPADLLAAFDDDTYLSIYYLPGAAGWGTNIGNIQTVLWDPLFQIGGTNFGVVSNEFVFNITGSNNIPIAIEACDDLAAPLWTPLQSVTLTNGSFHFSEPLQTGSPARFYRISGPQ